MILPPYQSPLINDPDIFYAYLCKSASEKKKHKQISKFNFFVFFGIFFLNYAGILWYYKVESSPNKTWAYSY